MKLLKTLNIVRKNKPIEELIFNKYKILQEIGKGAFGRVYCVQKISSKETFAMKTELLTSTDKNLEKEAYNLLLLQGFGIPKIITYGRNKTHNILIEELLGNSLGYIFVQKNSECLISDICMIGMQLLDRLKWIHSKNVIYRDIKPENILIGKKDPNVIYLIDFGLCKKYRSSKTEKHILPKATKFFSGNMKFASYNALIGKEQSRRDDLIPLGYVLIFLAKKNLPWKYEGRCFDNGKYIELIKNKRTNGNGSLFYDIPDELKEYIKYTINLKFEQEPDYEYLKSLLGKVLLRNNLDIKKIYFSWINPKNKKLIGSPSDKNNKKSDFRRRLLKNIFEKRTQENILPNDSSICDIKICSNIPKSNSQKNIVISRRIKTISNNPRHQNDISIPNNEIEKNKTKFINYTKNDSGIPESTRKIIKFNKNKLAKLDFNNNYAITLNSDSQRHFINFNKKNITSKNLKIITINNEPIIRKKDLSFRKNKIMNYTQNNTVAYTSEKNIFENKLNKRRNIIELNNILKNRNFNNRNDKLFNELNKTSMSPPKNNIKPNYSIYNINKTYNNYVNDNNFDNNKYLIYNQAPPNVGVMIINNYNNINQNRCKKIIIKKNNNNFSYI